MVTIHRSRFARLLAVAALIANILWPIAGRVGAQGAAGESELVRVPCPVHGFMLVPAQRSPDPAPQDRKLACALCGATSVALVSAAAAPALGDSSQATAPRLAFEPVHHQPQRSSSRPRAPPVLS
jgi:hypothetical protein